MLSERSQTKTNSVWFHLYVALKKQNKQKSKVMVAQRQGNGGVRGRGERD